MLQRERKKKDMANISNQKKSIVSENADIEQKAFIVDKEDC